MPEMNGEEAVGIIKHSPPPGVSPVIPVVAVTAHAMQGDRERFLAKGFDDYVSKPIDMDELDRVLERVLEVRNASRTPQ
jgi:CheY-like chemotaxis protein